MVQTVARLAGDGDRGGGRSCFVGSVCLVAQVVIDGPDVRADRRGASPLSWSMGSMGPVRLPRAAWADVIRVFSVSGVNGAAGAVGPVEQVAMSDRGVGRTRATSSPMHFAVCLMVQS